MHGQPRATAVARTPAFGILANLVALEYFDLRTAFGGLHMPIASLPPSAASAPLGFRPLIFLVRSVSGYSACPFTEW